MPTEQSMVITELKNLSRNCEVTMRYIADMSRSCLISATPGMIEKLIQARRLVDQAKEEFEEYSKTIKAA